MKNAYKTAKSESDDLKSLLSNLETRTYKNSKGTQAAWDKVINEYRANCNAELVRKQEEIKTLNNVLAQWISKFMELQDTAGTKE